MGLSFTGNYTHKKLMNQIKITIATEFSDAPGARFITDGDNSGELFYKNLLRDRFIKAKDAGTKLYIDFDNTWGYASSFISGAFGRLADEFGKNTVEKYFDFNFKSDDDPTLFQKVRDEINKSNNNA